MPLPPLPIVASPSASHRSLSLSLPSQPPPPASNRIPFSFPSHPPLSLPRLLADCFSRLLSVAAVLPNPDHRQRRLARHPGARRHRQISRGDGLLVGDGGACGAVEPLRVPEGGGKTNPILLVFFLFSSCFHVCLVALVVAEVHGEGGHKAG